MAIHAGAMLTEESTILQATNQRMRQKRDRGRHCIASGGVLQAQEGQALGAGE
jgi:hypothetical protein